MNKQTNYQEVLIPSTGKVIELKFGTGTAEMYCELMGLVSMADVDPSLICPIESRTEMKDGEEVTTLVNVVTPQFAKALRLFFYSAAYYAARLQNKPVDFNEYTPTEWFDEVGYAPFLGMTDQTPAEAVPTAQPVTS